MNIRYVVKSFMRDRDTPEMYGANVIWFAIDNINHITNDERMKISILDSYSRNIESQLMDEAQMIQLVQYLKSKKNWDYEIQAFLLPLTWDKVLTLDHYDSFYPLSEEKEYDLDFRILGRYNVVQQWINTEEPSVIEIGKAIRLMSSQPEMAGAQRVLLQYLEYIERLQR